MSEQIQIMVAQLRNFQSEVLGLLQSCDPGISPKIEEFPTPTGGLNRPAILEGGARIEKAAVHFSHTVGKKLPAAATERHPQLLGADYQAVSSSLIVHPRSPHAPTCHANFRYFEAGHPGEESIWWFGGGFDLTPYYGYEEDARAWHVAAKRACDRIDSALHPRLKEWCDRYFLLPHRKEARGIGGVFFDDYREGGFAQGQALVAGLGAAFLEAYGGILERRADQPGSEAEREWQLIRRGRYAEFNLLHDRGTRFGLQAGARTESLLASLPPLVAWRYDHHPAAGSAEEKLLKEFLIPRDWADRQ